AYRGRCRMRARPARLPVTRTAVIGVYLGAVAAGSAAGEMAQDSRGRGVHEAPSVVSVVSPPERVSVDPGSMLRVIVRASDATGVTLVRLRAEGAASFDQSVDVSPAQRAAMATFSLRVPADAGAGSTIKLIATAQDVAGNLGRAPTVTLIVGRGRHCRGDD